MVVILRGGGVIIQLVRIDFFDLGRFFYLDLRL